MALTSSCRSNCETTSNEKSPAIPLLLKVLLNHFAHPAQRAHVLAVEDDAHAAGIADPHEHIVLTFPCLRLSSLERAFEAALAVDLHLQPGVLVDLGRQLGAAGRRGRRTWGSSAWGGSRRWRVGLRRGAGRNGRGRGYTGRG